MCATLSRINFGMTCVSRMHTYKVWRTTEMQSILVGATGLLLVSHHPRILQTTFSTCFRFPSRLPQSRHVLAPRSLNSTVRKCFQLYRECSTRRCIGCIEPNSAMRCKILSMHYMHLANRDSLNVS
jgi:hypothetical protein